MAPIPFLQLFRYASSEDLILIAIANIFILYSSLNIPLVNIVYGLMMREMNDYVARRAQFTKDSSDEIIIDTISSSSNSSATLLNQILTNSTSYVMTTTTPELTSMIPILVNNSSTSQTFNGSFHDAQELFINNTYNLCMIVILFGATRFIALYLALLFFSIAASNQAKRVKLLFFKSLLRQEVAWFERNRTGDFAIRITSDLSKFEDGIGDKIALCLNALFAWMSSLISSFYYGWELTLVCLVLVPLTVFTTTVIAEFQASYSIKESSALSRAFNVCHEVISSIRTVLSFSGQKKEAERFKKGLDSAYTYGLHRNMFAGLNLGFTWMSGYLGFAICLLYSTKFYKPEYLGEYDEAHIITILWSAAGCVFLLNRMMPFIEIIQMARGSASNLFAVIERQSQIDVTSPDGIKPTILEANVKFENVTFTYPKIQHSFAPVVDQQVTTSDDSASGPLTDADSSEKKSSTCQDYDTNEESKSVSQSSALTSESGFMALRNMSMEVESGQTIALVGPSGSGKSTALALLQRFYEIDDGTITLGGYNLKDLNLAWLRSQFGVVTQEPVLFDMSIADNIRLGAKPGQFVSNYDIEQAARSANAHAFIARLPNGYDTRAGTRGVQLSGGQKQRIAIARALVRQPKILLLDEATSALDLESESIVQKALDQARIGRTTFIIAHRLSTVKNADRIIVFDKGTIVETGSHEELLQHRGLYYQINTQQRQGLDLLPPTRRGSQIGCGPLAVCLAAAGPTGCGPDGHHMNHYNRDSRSLSIYSTTGKYATGGFGAAGHGGNGEGVDNGGSCAAEPTDKFTDDDFYNRYEEDESDTSGQNRINDETQASLLDGDSISMIINSKGKKVSNLSISRVLSFIKPDMTCSLIGVLTSLLMGLCIPISAMIIGDIATIFSTDDSEEIRRGLYSHGILYTGLAMFAFVVSFIQVVSFGIAGEKIGINLRLRGFEAILNKDIFWFDQKRNNPGSICARLASDVGNVQSITGNRTAVIFQSISILVSTFIFAVYFNLKFSSICAMFVAILLISTVMQARYAGKLAVANRGFDSQIGKIVLESSANIKTLVSLHQQQFFIDKCEQLLNKDRRAKSLDNHLRLSLESLKYAMTAISKGSSFYFAARMLLQDEISIDVIFKLIEIILYGLTEASKSLIFISDLEKARRGAQNLYKLIYNKTESPPPPPCRKLYMPSADSSGYSKFPSSTTTTTFKAINGCFTGMMVKANEAYELPNCDGNIEFNNVRFHYPSRPDAVVLKSLNIDVPTGKTIALVGRSGCGKSTIVQLLQKFYTYRSGQILVDGKDLQELPTEWLRKQIAVVSQEPALLSYSIGDNIRYGDNSRYVEFDEVIKAAQVANIHEFIMSLPEGYETQLSEANSLQLSGGQKQRIAIARALIKQAPILVFDEATSALDTKSENTVQEALDRARVGKTSIIIAHRLSTIKNADLIVVLKEGIVVEQGSHQELLEKRGEYYCLYKTQSKL